MTLPVPSSPTALPARRPEGDGDEGPAPSLRGPVTAGLATIVVAFGGFLSWAFAARLDNAAVAPATIVVSSKRKTASHLEGGILRSILKTEGDVVREGEPLLLLDDTRARAELQQLRAKRVGFLARLTRLRAEQADLAELVYPADVADPASPVSDGLMDNEQRLFASRRAVYRGKISIQERVIEQAQAESDALAAQISATERQRQLIDAELKIVEDLWATRYVKRTQLVETQTRQSELVGKGGELSARRAKAEQAIAGAKLEILSIGLDRQNDVANDLQQTQLALSEVMDRMISASDILSRLVVVAPQEGSVTNLRFRTIGGVIGAGEPILDIVPARETLVVEARVEPRDIDIVRVGAETQVRLTAFNSRTLPPLPARVSYVAADQLTDDKTGAAYFVVRAEIAPGGLTGKAAALYPGMPAEVVIVNGTRRAIDYLVSPLAESFDRAFHED